MSFIDWVKENKEKNNLCDPEMDPQLALNLLKIYLIPDYYCVMPQNTKQVNTAIVFDILYKYSRKFRKEYKLYLKELKKHERRE